MPIQRQEARKLTGRGFPTGEPLTDCMRSAVRLIETMASGNDNSRECVPGQLVMLAKSASPVLTEAILKSDDNSRIHVSLALSRMDDPDVVPILKELQDDPHVFVRWNAIAGLRRLGAVEEFKGPRQRPV